MSHWQQQGHPPDPGITSPSQTIAAHTFSVLEGIKANTDYLSVRASSETCSPYLQALSYKSTYLWNRVGCLAQTYPTELLSIWFHVEDYGHLIHDIVDAVSSNTLTDAEANRFFCRLSDFVYEFEKTMQNRKSRSPCRPDFTASAPSIFQDTGRIDISRSNFLMNNTNQTMDPGLSDHLKQIKYILIFMQATVLF